MTIYFDLDGVLLDVEARYFAVYRSIVVGLGGRPLARAAYWRLKRDGLKELEICREHHREIDPAIYRHLFAQRIESPAFLAHDTLVAGARETLDALRPGRRLAIATLRRRGAAMRAQLRALKLDGALGAILQREDNDGGWESKASMILEDGGARRGALLVGDSEGDVRAARRAGIGAVAVTNGMRDRTRLLDEAPDHLIETIGHLPSCPAVRLGTNGPIDHAAARAAGEER